MFISNSSSQASGGVVTPPPPSGPTYQVPASLRFRSSASSQLVRTLGTSTSRTTFTDSFWVKRGLLGAAGAGELVAYYQGVTSSQTDFLFMPDDTLAIQDYAGYVAFNLTTAQVFRDTSAWYHIVFVLDTTNATASERVRLYVNSKRVTSFATANYPAQGYQSQSWQSGSVMSIGSKGGLGLFDGYLAEMYHVDGQALDASYFGQLDTSLGVWTAKASSIPSGLARTAFTQFANGATTDPNFAAVSLLVHGRGLDGATTIVDSSANTRPLTVTGAAHISTAQSKYSGSAIQFTGGVDYVYAAPSPAFDFGAGDFTLEGWYWIDSTDVSGATMFATRPGSAPSGIFVQYYANTIYLYMGDGSSWVVSATAVAASLNAWHHYAVVRSGTNVYIFVDGVVGSTTVGVTLALPTGQGMTLGIDPGNANNNYESFKGFMADVRVTKGVACYTTTFTPPIAELPSADSSVDAYYSNVALLAHFNGSNNATLVVDSSPVPKALTVVGNAHLSTAQSMFGGSSLYLDGTDSRVTAPHTTLAELGNSDFTIECYYYFVTNKTAAAGYNVLLAQDSLAATADRGWILLQDGDATGKIGFAARVGTTSFTVYSNAVPTANAWHHVAVVRQGMTLTLFSDGVPQGTTTIVGSINPCSVGKLSIGNVDATVSTSLGSYITGYIEDVRITPGVVRYTSQFYPFGATGLVDGRGNTLMVLNFNTNFVDQTTLYGNPTASSANGPSATVTTTQSKFGGSSAYFDGTGTSWVFDNGPGSANLGTSNFTLHFWAYPTAVGGGALRRYVSMETAANSVVVREESGTIRAFLRLGSSTVYPIVTTVAPTLNAWMHVALVRFGNLFVLYVNGVSSGTLTNAGAIDLTGVGAALGNSGAGGTEGFTGYLDDVVFLQNTAQWTYNFNPPTAAFPDAAPADASYSNVVLLLHGDGVDGSTTIVDSATTPKTATAHGAVTVSTAKSRFGGASLHFPGGSGDYIELAYSTDFSFGLGDFTVESSFYSPTGATYTDNQLSLVCAGRQNTSSGGGGWDFHAYDAAGVFQVRLEYVYTNGTTAAYVASGSVAMARDVWHHVAVCRKSGTTSFFIDGIWVGDTQVFATVPIDVPNSGTTLIGAGTGTVGTPTPITWPMSGYMDDVRITKGVARYANAVFTPPTTAFTYAPSYVPGFVNGGYGNSGFYLPFKDATSTTSLGYDYSVPVTVGDTLYANVVALLRFDGTNGSSTIVDDGPHAMACTTVGGAVISTTQSKYGGSAIAFNGSTSGVHVAISATYQPTTQPFTIEAWVYLNSSGTPQTLWQWNSTLAIAGVLVFYDGGTVTMVCSDSDPGGWEVAISAAVPLGQWVHVAVQRSPSNDFSLYVNGVLGATTNYTGALYFNNSTYISLGICNSINWWPLNGYMDDFRITYGVARYSGNFTPVAAQLGAIALGNNWTLNNLSLTAGASYDAMYDAPLGAGSSVGNGVGNYATLNPLYNVSVGAAGILSNGNLQLISSTTVGTYSSYCSTLAMTSGKWYFEMTATVLTSLGAVWAGIMSATDRDVSTLTGAHLVGASGGSGALWLLASTIQTGLGTSVSGDVLASALDLDAHTLQMYRNGVAYGGLITGIPTDTYCFMARVMTDGTSGRMTVDANFGQCPFAYTPPSGFKALHTGNSAVPSIVTSAAYFDVVSYTGTGAGHPVDTVAFQPDLVWIKSRSAAQDYRLVDSVRGTTNAISSDLAAAQVIEPQGLTSFDASGFSLGTDVTYNTSGGVYVAWQWKKGVTPGFDIVPYTGNGSTLTVSHALGVAPQVVIVKNLSASADWALWHTGLTSVNWYVRMNAAAAQLSDATVFSGLMSSTQFAVGANALVNASGNNYIAYVFSQVPGFSSLGSYTGNGSADGPFIYCGFRPRYVLVKNVSANTSWFVFDSARESINPEQEWLAIDNPIGETATVFGDFTANGFKLRTTNSSFNGASNLFIYMAFAETPFKYSLAR